MIIEIEKKYDFTQADYKTICSNCSLEKDEIIKDYYLDTSDYILTKNNYYLRIRNGVYELKIARVNKETGLIISQEITEDEEIEKVLKKDFAISIDDTSGIIFIETHREKFLYEMDGEKITVDIDTYQYGKRYEIEIISETKTEKEVNDLIENFRAKIGLTSDDNISASSKIFVCAQYQNIDVFEIMNNMY